MNLLLTGSVEGGLSELFDKARSQAAHWVAAVGNFGAYPDPARMDRAAKKHALKEFSLRYVGADPRPIMTPVLFIAGVHEDHRFLKERVLSNDTELLSNVHYLHQGYRTTIGFEGPSCRVTGLGRAYSEVTYNGGFNKRSSRHYTRRDVERACASGPTDLLLVYENLDAPGIRNIIYATRPKLIVTVKHPNQKIYDSVQNTPVITLGRRETYLVKWRNCLFVH